MRALNRKSASSFRPQFGVRNSEYGMQGRACGGFHTGRSCAALRTPHSTFRAGFTLVEMLVAVGLVVLMMSLFATIFQMSTAAMATQKGIAENDQRSRLALTLLRNDLSNRTAVVVRPFEANEQDDLLTERREGYFYISENDRDDDGDDVLALTVKAVDGDLFYGHAAMLLPVPPVPPNPNIPSNIATDPNQPEFDDGIVDKNNAGASQHAEVCYFLRAGTLYRRVLLIRQPIKEDSTNPGDGTPKAGPNGYSGGTIPLTRFTSSAVAGTESNFWTEFDYSAYGTGNTAATFNGPLFHGIADLSNRNDGSTNVFRLGKPNYRFGHNHINGLPREFVGTNFIGRFTQSETSYQPQGTNTPMLGAAKYFGYPGRIDPPDASNPMAAALTYDPALGIVRNYSLRDASLRLVPGPRASEDILLTNVQRFDIKVWDEAASVGPDGQPGFAGVNDDRVYDPTDNITDRDGSGNVDLQEMGWEGSDDGDFRDVGHNGAFGFYSANTVYSPSNPIGFDAGQTPTYCPGHPANGGANPINRTLYRFDTWNPNVNLNGAGAGDPPPFHAPLDQYGFRRPLKAIQIRITFFDVTSQQLRDVTFVQSLTN